MKKLSTRSMKHKNNRGEANAEKTTCPRQKTIDYLAQFARVYCSEKTLNTGHCGFVLN